MQARRLATHALAGCVLIAGAVVGWIDPHGVVGSTGWSLAAAGVLWGLGATAARALGVPASTGALLLLGATAWMFVGGVLLAMGAASRGLLLAVAGVGLGFALWELARRARAVVDRAAPRAHTAAFVVLAGLLGVYLALMVVGLVSSRGNPYDDHVAYTAFTKRLLDCGDLVEPFSFRRISAYGGQTILHSLLALRGDVEATDLLDRGLFQIVTFLLVIELARKRGVHPGATTLLVLFLISLPEISINSASTWTGLAFFLGAYGFASDVSLPRRRALALTFATCAAACTLRQNFILPAGLFAALVLVFDLRARAVGSSWAEAWRVERGTALRSIGVAVAFILPYAIATWRSNGTFLYPIMLGTANPAAPLQPTGFTFADELGFFFTVMVETEPIRIWWLLAPFMLLARDTRASRPWPALLIASLVGFALMIHSFTLSDATSLWRYASGYMTALAVVFVIEAAGHPLAGEPAEPAPPLRMPRVAIFFVWLALLTQLVHARNVPASHLRKLANNLDAAIAQGTARPGSPAPYAELQAAIPAGARVAVMLDDPYLLDYARHEIVNLDLPGFVAPAPGLPSFLGPERWRSYFGAMGIRYIAYVRGDYSTFLFRRRWWVGRTYVDGEIWRFMGAHIIDALDTFDQLARSSRVLFEREGLVAIDLGSSWSTEHPATDPPEIERQDRFLRDLAARELAPTAFRLASRSDVVFDIDASGPSALMVESRPANPAALGGLLGLLVGEVAGEVPHRWLSDRTHIRVLGRGGHRVRAELFVNTTRLASIPHVSLSVDGEIVARAMPDHDEKIVLEAPVACTGWCDVYIVVSSMAEFWLTADAFRGIKLVDFEWTAAP